MKTLIEKEFRLVVHPATYVLVVLGALVLIPSWMYGAIFIYGVLIAFFNGLNAREMHDLEYSFTLPVSRHDLVRARIAVMAIIEIVMLVIMAGCLLLRGPLGIDGAAAEQGPVGTAANLYLVGFGFAIYGIFNAVFYPLYWRDPAKMGVPFLVACAPVTLALVVIEALPYLPLAGVAALGVPGFADLPNQLIVLGACLIVFALGTLIAANASEKNFSTYDA